MLRAYGRDYRQEGKMYDVVFEGTKSFMIMEIWTKLNGVQSEQWKVKLENM